MPEPTIGYEDERTGPGDAGKAEVSSPSDPIPPWARSQPQEKFGLSPSPARPWLLGAAGSSLLGFLFAALSTSDFVNHLDRQLHAVHCSLIPGMGADLGESGCRTVMMSPYSSLFRETMWGGLPISLWAMAVFAYLLVRALHFALVKQPNRTEAGYLLLGTGLPVGMSVIYAAIALGALDSLCKLCLGIYVASAAAFSTGAMTSAGMRRSAC